jgi:hypothetical protein
MISAQTLRVCREEKPVPTFPDHALFRGLGQHHRRRERKPAVDESLEPGALDHVMDSASVEMCLTRLCAGLIRAAMRGPAAHHLEGDVGMELQAEGVAASVSLHRKIIAGGEQFGAARQLEPFAMPVLDLRRPVRA